MKKIFLICFYILSFKSFSQGMIFESYSEDLTTGINPATNELLSGSDWSLKTGSPNKTDCSEFTDEKYMYTQISEVDTVFIDKNLSCNDVSLVGNSPKTVFYSDLGLVQETFFDLESITCGVGQACDINQNIENLTQYFGAVDPTPGANGTRGGFTDLFIYNAQTITNNTSDGLGGAGGLANLPSNPSSVKYCIQHRDASTDGRSSVYAKTPMLNVKVINWRPFLEGASKNRGTDTSSNSKTNVIRGIDSTNRYFMGLENILDIIP